MAYPDIPRSQWSTRCFADAPDSAAAELAPLHAHLAQCRRPRGSALHGAAHEVGAFLLSRVVSTLLIVTVVLIGLWQVV